MRTRRSVRGLAVLPIALLALAACSEEGSPSAAPTPPQTESSTTTESAPNTTGGDVFAGIQACDLLNQALDGEGFPPGEVGDLGSGNGCKSNKKGFGSTSADLYDDLAYDDISGDPAKQFRGDVNGRQAILIKDALGGGGDCALSIEVKPSASANLGVTLDDTEEACAYVSKLAERVEPLLPGK